MAGDAALAATMRVFRDEATAIPMAEWPRRFWAALLAEPALRRRVAVAVPIDPTDRLGELATGPRAALLLRLAAGLPEAEAASVLGLGEASYRLALRGALPHHVDGRADPQAWQQLRDQVHRRIKNLPPERLSRLAQAREAVLRGETAALVRPPASNPPQRPRPRWVLPALWALLLLCVTAFVASWWWPGHGPGEGWGPGVRVDPLPAAEPPAATLSADAALVAHRDFALLADPEGEAAAADLPLQSWLVAVEAGTAAAEPATAGDPQVPPATPLEALPDATLAPLESTEEGDANAQP